MMQVEIGIFGGSGLYSILEGAEEIKVETPYGSPSDLLTVGDLENTKVVFLPRHGRNHQFPPHKIPYQANLWAMKSLGVKRIIAPSACGSLQPHVKPGDFVICDQFVDRTSGRKDTFYDGSPTRHVSVAEPYCPELRRLTIETAKNLKLRVHEKGTAVVVQGPRFSTKAESQWFKSVGWEVVNMTQYPEVALARELEMCYVNVSLVTDYDVWQPEPVTAEEVTKAFLQNVENVTKLIHRAVPKIPQERTCVCSTALKSSTLK
ncbi:MAG: S-methyl-5'-thioadenosine phosphorylase [Candidatus Bathyarchaeota archaeon]